MATQEELNNERELNRLKAERLAQAREEKRLSEDTLNDTREFSNLLLDQAKQISFSRVERREIQSIARQTAKLAQEAYNLDEKDLGTLKSKTQFEKRFTDLKKQESSIQSLIGKQLTDDAELNQQIDDNLRQQLINIQLQKEELGEVAEISERIRNNLGVQAFAGLEDLAKTIPGVRQYSGQISKAAEAARSAAGAGATAMEAFVTGLRVAGRLILPLLIINELNNAFTSIDKSTGEIAKNLGISYQQATLLRQSLTDIGNQSGNIFATTGNLAEAFTQINTALATNAQLSEEILLTQVALTKQAGYTAESASQIATLSLATGQSSEDIVVSFLGQAKALNLVNDTAVNEKTLLNDIAKLSKSILATFSAQPSELARASYEARRLGIELNQLDRIADGFLDIEQSLSSEFEAQVLLNRDLNFERARLFALTNDLSSLGKELVNQGITLEYYSRLNRVQREAIAASFNMQKDEMADMLLNQEALNKLRGIEGKTAQARFNNLVKEVGLEEAKRRLGSETLANQLASVSIQERFAQTLNKLKELFVGLVEPLLPAVEALADILSLAGLALQILDPFIQGLRVIAGAVRDIVSIIPNFAKGGLGEVWDRLGENTNLAFNQGSAAIARNPFYAPMFEAELPSFKMQAGQNVRASRNSESTMTIDYDKLADAIASGAERGTSRATVNTYLDSDRVSTRIQPALAVNTRRYAV